LKKTTKTRALPRAETKDACFLQKRSKRLYQSGLSLSGKAEAKTDKSLLRLFFTKEVLAS
jgi:hypothetical protein